ncbi:substrate-binding domain-containing protein [Kroppenstedtia sanguinis]|uniref:Substrate-binding domain-containing protein n=1 Tax=Kroppenstedtia sanguinis TaxID=1380684 RepID=A0ABW4C5F0_9BACL
MKKKRFAFVCALLAMCLLVAACGNADDASQGDKVKVGLAMKTQDSPYFVTLVEAVKKYAKEANWDLTVLDANGDVTKEAANIEAFIAQGKDLILLDAIEPDAVVPSIDKAAEAGIGVINIDSGVSEEANNITTVYSDNRQNGRLVGLKYAEKMGDKEIKAIVLSGAKGNVAGYERRTGLFAGIIEGKLDVSEKKAWKLAEKFEKELSSKGKASNSEAKFSVVGQGWGAWTEEEGMKAAEDLITANSGLTTVLGENDQMLFGAMTALKNAGQKDVDMVAGADGAKKAFDLIKEGNYFATGLNSPYLVAEKGIEIGKEILEEDKDPESYPKVSLTKPVAITKENVDKYYEKGF